MLLFPNPYCAIVDAKGRLAGACPEPEALRPGASMPMRVCIGARRVHDPDAYVDGDEGAGIDSRSDRWFEFDTKASNYHVAVSNGTDYRELVRAKSAFLVQKEDEIPLEELARARAKLMREIRIDHGMTPNTETWAKQFSLDVEVASTELYKKLEKEIDADVVKAAKALEAKKKAIAEREAKKAAKPAPSAKPDVHSKKEG